MYIQDQLSIGDLDDEHLSYFNALGVDSIHLELRGGPAAKGRRGSTGSANSSLAQDLKAGKDCTEAFEQAREKVEAHGMKLNNIFMPAWEEITLAEADMDEKIGHWCAMLEGLGRAGIPCVGWNFKPMGNFRTTADIGRGGVHYSTFDYAEFDKNRPTPHEPPVDEAQMWQYMEKFLKAAVPTAEKAGVRMGYHPNDPPISPYRGSGQIMVSADAYRRLLKIAPSPSVHRNATTKHVPAVERSKIQHRVVPAELHCARWIGSGVDELAQIGPIRTRREIHARGFAGAGAGFHEHVAEMRLASMGAGDIEAAPTFVDGRLLGREIPPFVISRSAARVGKARAHDVARNTASPVSASSSRVMPPGHPVAPKAPAAQNASPTIESTRPGSTRSSAETRPKGWAQPVPLTSHWNSSTSASAK